MKPRLIFHIGSPKTGSSSIQKNLFEARHKLRETCGMHYANTERSKAIDKHLSTTKASVGNDEARADKEFEALMDDFERSGAKSMLVTEEQMWTSKPSVSRFFARFTPFFEVDLVAYMRRQDLFIEGLYSQHLRLSRYQNCKPITEFWKDEKVRPLLDYHKILMRHQQAGLNVKAFEFGKEAKTKGLLRSFQQACGLEKLGELTEKMANPSPDMRVLLTLALIANGFEEAEGRKVIDSVFKTGRRLESAQIFPTMKHTLGRRERQAIIEHFAESNQKLADDFGVTFPESLPEEADDPVTVPDAPFLLALLGDMALTDGIRLLNCCRHYLEGLPGVLPEQKDFTEDELQEAKLSNYEAVEIDHQGA